MKAAYFKHMHTPVIPDTSEAEAEFLLYIQGLPGLDSV